MKKTFLFFTLTLLVFAAYSQKNSTTKTGINSPVQINNFTDSSTDKPNSHFELNTGIGNKLFSVKNNSVNATQSQINKIYFTPSISYHHKSGFSIAITSYLSSDSGAFKIYQTAITPSYDYDGDNVAFGISYSRYVADNTSYNTNATYQNDFYTNVKYKQTFIEPSLALGFANGAYNEINLVPYKPAAGAERIVKDSTNNTIRDFSLSIGVEHNFKIDSVFSSEGSLSFTPQLVLNVGTEKYTVLHLNKNLVALAKKNKRVKSSSLTESGKTPFEFQSLALSLSAEYSIGGFTISPNVYFDYYLPSTTENRLNTIFSLTLGYSF